MKQYWQLAPFLANSRGAAAIGVGQGIHNGNPFPARRVRRGLRRKSFIGSSGNDLEVWANFDDAWSLQAAAKVSLFPLNLTPLPVFVSMSAYCGKSGRLG
jgi:hypothetical protein